MNDLNIWSGSGRLTADPERKALQSGQTVCSFSLASNKSFSKNGTASEHVNYINCQAWGKLGDNVAKYCQKGKQVIVSGELKQERWQDQSGKNQSRMVIVCREVHFIGGGRQEGKTEQQDSYPPEPESDDPSMIPF